MAAYIDLKNCRFFIEDGWSAVGAVNLPAGYAIGLSALKVDGFTERLVPGNILTIGADPTVYTLVSETAGPNLGAVDLMAGYTTGATAIAVEDFTNRLIPGSTLVFASHGTVYTIVSKTDTSNATTAIVITPPLTAGVADEEVITVTPLVTTAIIISPALVAMAAESAVITVGPHVLEVTIGEGNCTFDEKRALEYKLNRGKLDQVRLGDEAPVDVNFQFAWTFLSSKSGGTVPSVEEFFYKTGPAANYKTTGLDCEPYAVNIIIEQTQPCASDDHPIERITLPQFRQTSLNHDPKAGTVTAQGTCNVTKVIRERLAASKDHV